MPEDLNINILLVVSWQNKLLPKFFLSHKTLFTWQSQVRNPASILHLPTGGVIYSAFSVVMRYQKSLGSSWLLEEHYLWWLQSS